LFFEEKQALVFFFKENNLGFRQALVCLRQTMFVSQTIGDFVTILFFKEKQALVFFFKENNLGFRQALVCLRQTMFVSQTIGDFVTILFFKEKQALVFSLKKKKQSSLMHGDFVTMLVFLRRAKTRIFLPFLSLKKVSMALCCLFFRILSILVKNTKNIRSFLKRKTRATKVCIF
jgi:hypothetical protein